MLDTFYRYWILERIVPGLYVFLSNNPIIIVFGDCRRLIRRWEDIPVALPGEPDFLLID
jgi:hypothetical protein